MEVDKGGVKRKKHPPEINNSFRDGILMCAATYTYIYIYATPPMNPGFTDFWGWQI